MNTIASQKYGWAALTICCLTGAYIGRESEMSKGEFLLLFLLFLVVFVNRFVLCAVFYKLTTLLSLFSSLSFFSLSSLVLQTPKTHNLNRQAWWSTQCAVETKERVCSSSWKMVSEKGIKDGSTDCSAWLADPTFVTAVRGQSSVSRDAASIGFFFCFPL